MQSASPMTQNFQAIREWHDVDETRLTTEILTQYQPAVLRGFVRNWPIVQQARRSPDAVCRYLKSLDSGAAVDAILMPPEVQGRIFYNENMDGFNYLRNKLPLSAVIDQVARYAQFEHPPSVAVQSALIPECLPKFSNENRLPFFDETIMPRIWLGNKVTTPAHMDTSHNIACVVSGTRRFTLFPPDQVASLYIGPLDFAPTASPISMVDFKHPDYERYPQFKQALDAAQVAELEPGDAIYIPTLWWHHVESLKKFNVLVNYWWQAASRTDDETATPLECLLHCLSNLKNLPPEQRAAWGVIFNHYVFNAGPDPAAHIPAHARGILSRSPMPAKPAA